MKQLTSEFSATGIHEFGHATAMADGYADLYGSAFVVLHYPSESAYDVEPFKPGDEIGTNHVVYVTQ